MHLICHAFHTPTVIIPPFNETVCTLNKETLSDLFTNIGTAQMPPSHTKADTMIYQQ